MNNNSSTDNNTIIPGSNLQPTIENKTSYNNVNNGQIMSNQVQAIMPNDNLIANNFTLSTTPNIVQPTIPNNNTENNQVSPIMPITNNNLVAQETFNNNPSSNMAQPTMPNNNDLNNQISPIIPATNDDLVAQGGSMPSILPNNNPIRNTINNLGDNSPLSSESENYIDDDNNFVSIKTYLSNFFLFSIPIVGFILILIKSFDKQENRNIKNFSRALLLYSLIIMVIMWIIICAGYMYLPMPINGR